MTIYHMRDQQGRYAGFQCDHVSTIQGREVPCYNAVRITGSVEGAVTTYDLDPARQLGWRIRLDDDGPDLALCPKHAREEGRQ